MAQIRKNINKAPAYLFGKLAFEFFNNDSDEFKNNSLRRLSKELRKDFNVSCCPIQDTVINNPERGVLVVGIAAPSKGDASELANKILTYLDSNMPARIVDEDWIGDEF